MPMEPDDEARLHELIVVPISDAIVKATIEAGGSTSQLIRVFANINATLIANMAAKMPMPIEMSAELIKIDLFSHIDGLTKILLEQIADGTAREAPTDKYNQ
jgi:hypothetical protein